MIVMGRVYCVVLNVIIMYYVLRMTSMRLGVVYGKEAASHHERNLITKFFADSFFVQSRGVHF